MAKLLTNIPNNITEYPNSFKRQGAFPLEAHELFYSKSDAEEYAKNSPIAYVGQTIKVIENGDVKEYIIKDTTGTLYNVVDAITIINMDGKGVPTSNYTNWNGEFEGYTFKEN